MPLCCLKRNTTVEVLQCDCSGSTTPLHKGQETYWYGSIGADKLAQGFCGVVFPPPPPPNLSKVPKVLGGGEDRKQALFLLPKPKNNWDSIATTFKPHKYSVKPEIFILCANSHTTLRFCLVSLSLSKQIRRLWQGSLLFWGAEMSLLPDVLFNYSFFPTSTSEVS